MLLTCPFVMDKSYSMPMPLLGLLVKIKVFGVLPAHWALVLDAGTVLVFVPLMICAGFVSVGSVGQYMRFKIVVHSVEGCCTATTMALSYMYLNSSTILGADHWSHMSFGRWKLTIRVQRYLGQGVSRHTEQLANQEPYYALSDHMTSSKVWPIDLHFEKQ